MVGYGPEDNHFVMELTYNYGMKEYKRGNDFKVNNKYIVGWSTNLIIIKQKKGYLW